METVNWYMLNDLLSPIGGTGDVDEECLKYQNLDSNDEGQVKKVIMERIYPYYYGSSASYQKSVRISLSYFLTTNRLNYGRLFDSCLIAFDHPVDSRDFFLWIWECLFPNENYRMKNVKDYQEIEDLDEPLLYL